MEKWEGGALTLLGEKSGSALYAEELEFQRGVMPEGEEGLGLGAPLLRNTTLSFGETPEALARREVRIETRGEETRGKGATPQKVPSC